MTRLDPIYCSWWTLCSYSHKTRLRRCHNLLVVDGDPPTLWISPQQQTETFVTEASFTQKYATPSKFLCCNAVKASRYVPRRATGGAASFRPRLRAPANFLHFASCRHRAIQQTNQFVLELASLTLQSPNEVLRSLVPQLFQLSPQTRSALDQIQILARMTAYSRTAQEPFLLACFNGPHSR